MQNFLYNMNAMFAGTWVLFSSLFLMMLGAGLQGSLLGIRGADEGFSTFILSLISSGYYIGFFAGSIIVPTWLKRVGYIRVFAALVAVASVAAIAYPMLVEQYTWFVMRLLTGFCFAGIFMIAESWLNTQTHNDNRAKVLGAYVIILFIGMTTGQILLNLGDIDGYFLFALGSVVISLASVPLLLANRPVPVVEESTVIMSIVKVYKRSPLGVVSLFFANFINGGIVGMAAIYAKTVGMSTDKISLFVAAAYIGVIFLQFPIGSLSDRIDRRKVIIVLGVLTIFVSFVAMQTENDYALIIVFCLLGGLALPLYALSVAYVNDRLMPEEVLPATSALIKIAGIGNMLAPLIIGASMVKFGANWFFGSLSIAAAVIVFFGTYRALTSREVDVEEQGEYAPMAIGTTAATMSLVNEGAQLEFDFGDAHLRPVIDEDSNQEQTEENTS